MTDVLINEWPPLPSKRCTAVLRTNPNRRNTVIYRPVWILWKCLTTRRPSSSSPVVPHQPAIAQTAQSRTKGPMFSMPPRDRLRKFRETNLKNNLVGATLCGAVPCRLIMVRAVEARETRSIVIKMFQSSADVHVGGVGKNQPEIFLSRVRIPRKIQLQRLWGRHKSMHVLISA